MLCRNPYSRSQRTPCPAPPPAQSRRREVGGREGRHTPRDRVVVEVEDPRRATATGRPGGRPSHFHGWQYVAIPATTCSGAGGARGVQEEVVELHEKEVVELHEEEVVAGSARCCCAPRSAADAREAP